MIRLLKRFLELMRISNDNETLALEQTLVNALMDNIPDSIYFKDKKSRFIRINKALANSFKLSDPALAIGKTDFDFFTDEHARQAYNDEQTILQTGQPISKEEKETWENQADSWVSTVKMPLRNDKGKIIGTFGISRDITNLMLAEFALKEKNAEIEAQNEEYLQMNEELQQTNEELVEAKNRAEESDRLKTAFLHNISHEIRTPLNAIMGFSGFVTKHYNNKPKLEGYAQIINQQCHELLGIVNEIMDIAKLESGQLKVNLGECDLDQLFSEVLSFSNDFQKRLHKKNIELLFTQNSNLSGLSIISDKIKLKQIFINLIENAFKFTTEGKIEFGCKLNILNNLIFFVSDTGIGIAEDKQDIIFERFTQIEQGNANIYGGAGMGLTIVKGFIELLGGKIWLESEIGKGSTFYFSIPFTTNVNDAK